MSNTKHTPEPWGNATHGVSSFSNGGGGTVNMSFDDYIRAVACVNACAGIPTEDLINFVKTIKRDL